MGTTSNSQDPTRSVWDQEARHKATYARRGEGHGHPALWHGGLLRVRLRPEPGRICDESILLMLSISFMRMDCAAGIIYTNGDDKF